jgi:hypothetical protein
MKGVGTPFRRRDVWPLLTVTLLAAPPLDGFADRSAERSNQALRGSPSSMGFALGRPRHGRQRWLQSGTTASGPVETSRDPLIGSIRTLPGARCCGLRLRRYLLEVFDRYESALKPGVEETAAATQAVRQTPPFFRDSPVDGLLARPRFWSQRTPTMASVKVRGCAALPRGIRVEGSPWPNQDSARGALASRCGQR